MDRREFMATVGLASVSMGAFGASAATDKRPNILFVLSDQHHAACLGCYGHPDVRTPNLDAIAREGVQFERCYCPYPVCTPSRYSMLSGQYVHEHGGWSNKCTLPATVDTFPKRLRAAGYKTAAVGKMHHTPTYLDVGFDRMFLSEQDGDGRWDDDYHRELMANDLVDATDIEDQRRDFRNGAGKEYWETCGAIASDLPEEFHPTEWTGRKALEIVEQWRADENNLLMVSFIKPHHPFDPPQSYKDKYDPETLTIPAGWTETVYPHDLAINKGYFPHETLTMAQLRKVAAYYYANIEHIDAQVGRLVEALKRKGIYENTVIVYASDHGEYLGQHHLLLKGGYMYESLARVPLIARFSNGARAGEVSSGLVSLVDLAPTFLAQAGCSLGEKMKGMNLAESDGARDAVFADGSGGKQVMLRTATHKLIISSEPAMALLYDLTADPLELTNRYGDPAYAEVQSAMETQLRAWRTPGDLTPVVVDMDAPQINQPNVPPRDLSHREAIAAYYRKKIDERRGATA